MPQAAALRVIPESPLSDDVALHYTDMYKERAKPTVLSGYAAELRPWSVWEAAAIGM